MIDRGFGDFWDARAEDRVRQTPGHRKTRLLPARIIHYQRRFRRCRASEPGGHNQTGAAFHFRIAGSYGYFLSDQ